VSSWHELTTSVWMERGRRADGVFVQYFPQAYVGPDFAALVSWLDERRRAQGRVTVTLHEYWPHPSLSPTRMIMRWRSREALRALVRVSTSMVVSQPYSVSELNASGLVPPEMVHVIPVGSAVPVVPVEPEPIVPVLPVVPVLVMFGQPAMMNAAAVAEIARWLPRSTSLSAGGPMLWWFSRSEGELRDWWSRAIGPFSPRVEFLGGLPADEISRRLQHAALGLALYVDGASTRRSSLAALIEHGLPIVAIEDRYTDDRLRQSGAFELVRPDNPGALPGAISALLSNPGRRAEMSTSARRLFETVLAWPRIAAAYRALDGR
jgi:glycosyltransferase involved in cell wall biosynthesis